MQHCTTILGIIDMRQRGISFDDCRSRYNVGNSTITLIMKRFTESGKDLNTLKQMPAEEVEIKAGYEAGTVSSGSHALTVNGGSGSGMYDAGTAVTITHDPPETGMSFAYWLAVGYTESFNSTQDSLTITMPDSNVIFTAVFTSE